MTRERAAEKLQQGYKINHRSFTDDEYLVLEVKDKGRVLTEDGYDFTEQFWKLEQFADNWETVQES